MNIGIFTGRLTADATFRNGTEPSKNNARFTVAVTDPWNSEKTDFFTVSCFGKKADYVMNGLQKGRFLKGCEIEISGPVHLEKYVTQNGEERCYIGVIAETIYCKAHKDYKAAQNAASSANGMVQVPNNGQAGSYHQNERATSSRQYGGQNVQSGKDNHENQYGGNSAYSNQGNTPSQQFNRPNSQPGSTGPYNGNPGYRNQDGRPQQYNGQNERRSQYDRSSGYNNQAGSSPSAQYDRRNTQNDNQYRENPGFDQRSVHSQYDHGNTMQTSDPQYSIPAGSMPYTNIPDTIPAPEYKQEQEGGFRPATYHYE